MPFVTQMTYMWSSSFWVHVLVFRDFLDVIERKVHNQRPPWWVDAAKVNPLCGLTILLANHSMFPRVSGTIKEDYCITVEMKKAIGIDIWNTHYERMHEHLRKLKEMNRNLRKKIRQMMGECLNDLGYEQIINLIEDIDNFLKLIRERLETSELNHLDFSEVVESIQRWGC